MKAVLISIQPKWCELIASGKKTIEVRKTRPKIETPFRCYIYCTNGKPTIFIDEYFEKYAIPHKQNGKVIGEFVCNKVEIQKRLSVCSPEIVYDEFLQEYVEGNIVEECGGYSFDPDKTCLTEKEIDQYGKGKSLYGWHISDLKIYDKPKELGEFRRKCNYASKINCHNCSFEKFGCTLPIIRPPQSWCYVEE